MFIELMPRIEKRAITITVAALKDRHVRGQRRTRGCDSSCEGGARFRMANRKEAPDTLQATKGTNNRHLRLGASRRGE
jgi:hypothetical protein